MAIKIEKTPEYCTVDYGTIEVFATLPKEDGTMDRYTKKAQAILDELSKTYNAQGIDIILFCLAREAEGGNYGKDNI